MWTQTTQPNEEWLCPVFMITDGDHDFYDLIHSVCIPYNRLNLYKFYKDFLMTFQNEELPLCNKV